MVTQPTVISTFAGCGGSSLGYQMAGFKELLAVEWDKIPVATFKLNFPDVPAYCGDIKELSVEKCCQLASIILGQLDVLDGSPPCQGFSISGKRKFNDPRNGLAFDFIRLIAGLKPKVFIMENVTGLVTGAMKQAYLIIIRAMRDCGYKVKGQVLNAKYFGVPQSRRRVIVVGVRNDLEIEPSYPVPQTEPKSIREALHGLDINQEERRRLLAVGKASKSFRWWSLLPCGKTMEFLKGKGKGFNVRKENPDLPATTIMKDDGDGRKAWHWAERRTFTIGEFMRFASYPDNFQFAGTYKDAVSQIGNSVPPLFMKAIAEHIKNNILRKEN